MRIRPCYSILTLCFCLFLSCFTLNVSAQAVPGSDTRATSFPEMQKAFADWSQDKDLSQERGWKWYKRWEDEQARRADGHGAPYDPVVYAKEADRVMHMKQNSTSKTGNTSWIPIGPFDYPNSISPGWVPGVGRINCMAFHPTDANTLWVGVAQGGIWKTTDLGTSWVPLNNDLPILRISDISIDPNNTDIMYLSIGDYAYLGVALETDGRKRNTHYGMGVYKSTNGGQNWSPTGLSFSNADFDGSLTRRVFVNPSNSQNLLAAGTHGVWRSMDGGAAWTQVNDSLIWDIEQDPSNANTLYASSGYSGYLDEGSAAIHKSTDFGVTWTTLNTGIPPKNAVQRIELAISSQDPNYIYAFTCDMNRGFYGLYRSTNAGTSWTLRSTTPNILNGSPHGSGFGGQGAYDMAIVVDPTNKDRIYTGGINLWGSLDGGVTWDGVSYWRDTYGPTVHADQHFLAYNPLNSQYFLCNDGGLYRTSNIVVGSWVSATNSPSYNWPTQWTRMSTGMNTTSFYRVGVNQNDPDNLIAGAQDNATYYLSFGNWYNIIGGDGMDCFLHPTISDYLFGSWQYGTLMSSQDGGYNTTWLNSDITESGEWIVPWFLDPQNSNTVYAGYGNVWKSTSSGSTWVPISSFPNVPQMGQANLISAMAISPSNSNYLYAAQRVQHGFGEPGALQVTTNGGSTWQDRTAGLPDSLYFTWVTVDDQDPDIAWLTCGGFTDGAKVYKTTDAGQSWNNISLNLPNLPANCIVQHNGKPNNPVYVGTDVGVWYTNDTLTQWELYSDDLPNVIVSDLEIRYVDEKLVGATFGRGLWEVDLKDKVSSGLPEQDLWTLDMQVYPNPSKDGFSLDLKGVTLSSAQLEVLDVMGRTVYAKDLELGRRDFQQKFTPTLEAGVYYIRLVSGNFSKSVKWVKAE